MKQNEEEDFLKEIFQMEDSSFENDEFAARVMSQLPSGYNPIRIRAFIMGTFSLMGLGFVVPALMSPEWYGNVAHLIEMYQKEVVEMSLNIGELISSPQ